MTAPEAAPSPRQETVEPSWQHEMNDLLRQRLAYAPRIAWIKYQAGLPIDDSAREAVLLAELETEGRKLGLDPGRVRDFFSAQMAAFQQVQRDEIAAWKSGRPAPVWAPMDLQAEIRPAIRKLNTQMLAMLARPGFEPSPALARSCEAALWAAGFSASAARLAAAPLNAKSL